MSDTVRVPIATLDRIARDCEHGSRIWKEVDALLREHRLSAAPQSSDGCERDRAELMEALREFIEIDENGAGLLTRHPSGSDFVLAISEARALLARLEGK